MIVDIEEREERGTFDLEGGGKVHLRLLSADDMRAIRKACSTVKAEYPLLKDPKTGQEYYQRFESTRFDPDLFEEMRWDRCIVGWDDIFDRNEKPIPVTKENKMALMQKVKKFAKAVNGGLKALQKAEKDRIEAAEKN